MGPLYALASRTLASGYEAAEFSDRTRFIVLRQTMRKRMQAKLSEIARELFERGQAALGHVEMGPWRQLGVDEELALDELRHELAAEPGKGRQTDGQECEGHEQRERRMAEDPGEMAPVDAFQSTEEPVKGGEHRP